jgi:hypothetical protein
MRRLDRRQAETMREGLADHYVESSLAASGEAYRQREEFLRRLAADVRRPGFGGLVAQGRTPAGCAFGLPVGHEGSWWKGFVGTLPEKLEQLTASGHVFALSEIMIHPHKRDRAAGRRLQEALLANQDAPLGVTMVDGADAVACAAFLSWGWLKLGEARVGHPPGNLRVAVKHLCERTAGNPDGLTHGARTQSPEGSAEKP